MSKVRTHYDNLKVARDAPIEVIVAAYKSLSKKYHPDINDSEDAARIFKIINSAYEVLSDNSKRREHDIWIVAQEREQGARFVECEVVHPSKVGKWPANSPRNYIGIIKDKMPKKITLLLAVIAGSIIVVLIGNTSIFKKKEEAPAPQPYSVPNTAQPYIPQGYTPVQDNQNPVAAGRPVKIPEIRTDHTGYVQGSPIRFRNGYASITVDNTGNDSAVLVKLFNIDFNSTACYFTILAKDRFTVTNLNRGNYDVKYTFYKKGFSRSEPFYLKEIHNDDGVQYSNITMTLYKVIDGNMRTTDISEDEFVKGD